MIILNSIVDFVNYPEIILLLLCGIWDFMWKGIALYKAGQRSQGVRFVFIFIFNTLGILPIVYLILNRDK